MLGGICVWPRVRPCGVTLLTDFQEVQKYLRMKSKNVGVEVILHAEFDSDIHFHRIDQDVNRLKNTFFQWFYGQNHEKSVKNNKKALVL